MIKSKQIHAFVKQQHVSRYTTLCEELATSKRDLDVVVNKLNLYRGLVDNYSNSTFDTILNDRKSLPNLIIKHYSRDVFPIELSSLKALFEIYYDNLDIIKGLEVSIAVNIEFRKLIHKPFIYTYIIRLFNVLISDQIIKGYTFSFGHRLAILQISRKRRAKPTIHWGKTNALKAKLLAEGKTLYNKDTNPEGSKYLCYNTEEFTNYWDWKKCYGGATNIKLFVFKPTIKFVDALTVKLTRYVNANPNIVHKYNYVKSKLDK